MEISRNVKLFFVIAIVGANSYPRIAIAGDSPSIGSAYNTKENSYVQYECVPVNQQIKCSFSQVRISRKLPSSEISKRLESARSEYQADSKKQFGDTDCKRIKSYLIGLENGKVPSDFKKDFAEYYSAMSLPEKSAAKPLLIAALRFCESPTEANYIEFAKVGLEKDSRTCNVTVNPYTQIFSQIANTDKWVVNQSEGPLGVCGVVNISRFEKDGKYPLWNYFAKKVVTNKAGEITAGYSCAELDETEFEYSWKSDSRYVGCDFIAFNKF